MMLRFISISALIVCMLSIMFLWLRGCSDGHRQREPRDVWMTYEDGPLPIGRNGYLDASGSILDGNQDAKRYELYAFVMITSKIANPGAKKLREFLATSIEQCREDFSDAYRLGTLRQTDSLRNQKTRVQLGSFKPKYIVFLLWFGDDPTNQKIRNYEADFGTVIPVDQVFSAKETSQAIAEAVEISAKPQRLNEPSRSRPPISYWRDEEFFVIEQFERAHGIVHGNAPPITRGKRKNEKEDDE